MIDSADPGVRWLLETDEPAVRRLALTDVLGRPADDPQVLAQQAQFADGPITRQLLSETSHHVYAKWQGPFWRLTALVELGVPPRQPQAAAYLTATLDWLHNMERHRYPPRIAGLTRAHAVWHGHALAAGVALKWPDTSAIDWLVERLLAWQWPDGGWNCDRHRAPACSSVHETLGPLWGLAAYHRATGHPDSGYAAQRAAEFLLERRLFRSRRGGEVINPTWLSFRHPAYYHYNVLQALWVLAGAGMLTDPRADEAVALVSQARRNDGRWNANGRWWKPPNASGSNVEVADWGPGRPNLLITLKALTVLSQR